MRGLAVFSLVLASTVSIALADAPPDVTDGETIYIELGDQFNGDLGDTGGVVYANFNAVAGTLASMNVRSNSLQIDLTLLDGAGNEMDLTGALIDKGKQVEIRDFYIPMPGNYTFVILAEPFEIEGNSGNPGFSARSKGRIPSDAVLTDLSGVVTNSITGEPLAGVGVHVGPYLLVTDDSGFYAGSLGVGAWPVMAEAQYFLPLESAVLLLPLTPSTLNIALVPEFPVIVEASVVGDVAPGAVVNAVAEIIILDGSTLMDVQWTQLYGAPAMIRLGDTAEAEVSLGTAAEYKDLLFDILAEPPIGEDEFPPNVPVPEGEFHGGLQDRFQVVGLNPFSLEETALVVLEVEVVTSSGTYHADTEVHTHLPWSPVAGIHNVPIGVTVLLHGKDQASYDWSLSVPDGSGAMLLDGTAQNPEFVPDVPGLYTVSEVSIGNFMAVDLQIYAGTHRGIIVGQDDDGRPLAEPACVSCHQAFGADKFTPWAQTGHAEILTNNLNTSTHYGPNCFPCHSVGYDPAVDNGGFDDAPDYDAFLGSGLLNNPGDNWTTMLADYPAAAQLANIQCENCHGPQNAEPGMESEAHMSDLRATLSSDGCATCHGEPLRHARFQQWQLSGHANYELAIDESGSGNCSRCHTANGFLTWLPILTGDEPGDPYASIPVNWTEDEAHPQTCATCHDPHDIGTTSGGSTNATVRISGNTPPLLAGFTAYGVGRGAICMTCHNSRRGLRNDDNFDDHYGTSEAARAPHGSSQTDLLMGQNAYLVDVGDRGNHSFLADTCAQCHMVQTPPPDILSYNQGGTNHTFFAAEDVCAECHTGFDSPTIQGGVQSVLDELQGLIEEAILDYMDELIGMGYAIDLNGDALITDTADIEDLVFGEARGRQAITVTFIGGEPLGPYRMTDVDVVDGNGNVIMAFYDEADPALIKAGWNWNLVNNDGSLGVHNPSYAYLVLGDAIAALSANGAAPAVVWPDWMEMPAPWEN